MALKIIPSISTDLCPKNNIFSMSCNTSIDKEVINPMEKQLFKFLKFFHSIGKSKPNGNKYSPNIKNNIYLDKLVWISFLLCIK